MMERITNKTPMSTLMIELHSFALQSQEVEVGNILMLRHTKNLPSFQVKHNLSLSLILLTLKTNNKNTA